jgi:hypothetical protein
MGIRETWNLLEAVLVKRGFPLADADDAPQGRRCTIRVIEVPGDQQLRGSIGSGTIRLVFALEVALSYEVGNDKRVERRVAEDAEDVIAAIYDEVNLTNHHFVGASIQRDAARGVIMNVMRFDFQSQASL